MPCVTVCITMNIIINGEKKSQNLKVWNCLESPFIVCFARLDFFSNTVQDNEYSVLGIKICKTSLVNTNDRYLQ